MTILTKNSILSSLYHCFWTLYLHNFFSWMHCFKLLLLLQPSTANCTCLGYWKHILTAVLSLNTYCINTCSIKLRYQIRKIKNMCSVDNIDLLTRNDTVSRLGITKGFRGIKCVHAKFLKCSRNSHLSWQCERNQK